MKQINKNGLVYKFLRYVSHGEENLPMDTCSYYPSLAFYICGYLLVFGLGLGFCLGSLNGLYLIIHGLFVNGGPYSLSSIFSDGGLTRLEHLDELSLYILLVGLSIIAIVFSPSIGEKAADILQSSKGMISLSFQFSKVRKRICKPISYN
jgi:hypothetical protein